MAPPTKSKDSGLKALVLQAKAKLPATLGADAGRPGLPTAYNEVKPSQPRPRQLTTAAIVYTIGAGILFVMALYNLTHGSYFNGVVIFVPAGSLLVLAYKYLQ